jgi:hypothetical protein
LTGTNHIGDAVTQGAKTDLTTAYLDAQGRTPPVTTYPPIHDLGGETLAPGIYKDTSSFGITGTLTLDAGGDPSAVFIFQAGSTLITESGSEVKLTNGAQACNVFWQVGSSATLKTNSIFNGNILALTSITLNTGASVVGRVLAQNGAVTLDTNTITKATCAPVPATLHVIKAIVNTGGGTAVPNDFMVYVKNGSGANVSGSPANGTSTPGASYSLAAGTYVVSEDINASYAQSFSASCPGGSVTLAAGDNTTCTITNTYIPPSSAVLHVVKLVVNTSGTAIPSDFNVHVKNSSSTEVSGSPLPGVAAPGTPYVLSAGTYTVSEDTNSSYVRTFTGTACDSNGNVTLSAGNDKTCTIVNTDIPVPGPVVSSGSAGSTGSGRIVPLIGILKIPTPLALPGGSGSVKYNYTVWNVGGQQALTDVTVTDDKCSPVAYISGDLNGNGKLDPGEKWKYSCTTILPNTTTNTSIATGYSDDGFHQAAIATAIATVVVGAPTPPPLINIVKVPSRLIPFPYGGGDVTYTYTVTNPGVVAMHNVAVTDNKCSPVSYASGDANSNGLLDPGETWTYTCKTNVQASTRNVATAEGKANGFTALGYAFATVLVSAPGLPNTGLPPRVTNMWDVVMLVLVILVAASASVIPVLRKRRI